MDKRENILLHLLYRILVIVGVGILFYLAILGGKKDNTMGYGVAYTLMFTAMFAILFVIIDTIVLYVRGYRKKFKANIIFFGVLTVILLYIASYAFV